MMKMTEEKKAFAVALYNAKKRGVFFDVVTISKVLTAIAVSAIFAFVGDRDWTYRHVYYLCGGFVMILVCLLFCRYEHLSVRETLGLSLPKARYWLYACLLFVGITFGLSKLNEYFITFLEKFAGYKYQEMTLPTFSAFNYIAVVFTVCLVPAVSEELVFRGVISGGTVGGGIFAALANGFVFAIYHASPAQTVYQFAVGFLFALLARSSRSVLPTAVVHFLNNLFIVSCYYFLGGEIDLGNAGNIMLSTGGLLCVAAFCFLIFRKKREGAFAAKWLITSEFLKFAVVGMVIYAALWIMSLLNV